jgi:N6-L-threonylcarbamoyladenine synthase
MTDKCDLTILGIETSCDETAAAVVRGRPPGPGVILSSVIASQANEHAPFGGVVPEIAARAHATLIDAVTQRALADAGVRLQECDGVAVTAGPGLIGGVVVGLMFAKGLALAANKPLLAVNHLAAHALTVRLTSGIATPFLLLLVSGGHCQILLVRSPHSFERLGTTIDDAAGEAFDKTAKLLGLGFPGGPAVEACARGGDPKAFELPRPMMERKGLDFSFSGLKTAVRRIAEDKGQLSERWTSNLCASFQAAVGDILSSRSGAAMAQWRSFLGPEPRFVAAGGVASNQYLRDRLRAVCDAQGYELFVPPVGLCTDNAAMVSWAGIESLSDRIVSGLDVSPRARWPLDERYANIKGAKA